MPGSANRDKQKRARVAGPAGAPATADVPGRRTPGLAATLHDRIIPQLALAQASAGFYVSVPTEIGTPLPDAEIQKFATLTLHGDLAGAHAFVSSLIAKGMSLQSSLLMLLAPAARRLQAGWLAEECSFSEVAAALALLHQLVSSLAESTPATPPDGSNSG